MTDGDAVRPGSTRWSVASKERLEVLVTEEICVSVDHLEARYSPAMLGGTGLSNISEAALQIEVELADHVVALAAMQGVDLA